MNRYPIPHLLFIQLLTYPVGQFKTQTSDGKNIERTLFLVSNEQQANNGLVVCELKGIYGASPYHDFQKESEEYNYFLMYDEAHEWLCRKAE